MPWTLRPSRALGWSLPPVSAAPGREHSRLLSARTRTAVARWAFTAAAVLLLLAWVLCVWLIAREMVGWWVEFGIRMAQAPPTGPIPGW